MPTAALRAIPPSTATVDYNKTGHAVKCRRMYSHPVSVQHDTYPEMKLAGLWPIVTQLVTQLTSFQSSASSVSAVRVALVVVAEALQAYSVRHEVRCELFILLTAVSWRQGDWDWGQMKV